MLTLSATCRDVDKVHDLMEDIQEQQDVSREISDLISNPAGFRSEIDDEELLQELEELEQEEIADRLLEVPSSDSIADDLPTVPSARPVAAKKKSEQDDELAELAQWAS